MLSLFVVNVLYMIGSQRRLAATPRFHHEDSLQYHQGQIRSNNFSSFVMSDQFNLNFPTHLMLAF